MRRIAVINQKGGVGKTTTCANLGAALALSGRRVVLVDMDAQANLTMTLDVRTQPGSPSSYAVLTGASTFGEALRPTSTPNLQLVPADIDLSGAELELAAQMGREHVLREAIDSWEEQGRREQGRAPADYVLFDCPPSLGLLSINALAAAGEVLIAIQTEFLALQGMSRLVEILQLLKKRLNPRLEIAGILPCLYDSRLKLAREVLAEIRKYFPGKVLPTSVRSNVKLAEAPSFGKTIFEYAPDSNGASDYLAVAREIARGESQDPDLRDLPEFGARGAGETPTREASPDAPADPNAAVSPGRKTAARKPRKKVERAVAAAEPPGPQPSAAPTDAAVTAEKPERPARERKTSELSSSEETQDSEVDLPTVVLDPQPRPEEPAPRAQGAANDAFQSLENYVRRG
jgi:chromosome partitioning protein